MSEENQSGGEEKTHDPTAKKLEDARRKGDIPRSQDITAAAGYLGLILGMVLSGAALVESVGSTISNMLDNADEMAANLLAPGGTGLATGLMVEALLPILPLFLVPLILVILALFAQRAIVFAPDKLLPKTSRISPLSVAKNKFGPTGLFEFGKSFVKLLVISIAVGVFLSNNHEQVLGSVGAEPRGVSVLLATYLQQFLWLVFLIAIVISVFDYFWQRYDHKRKLMMSRKDMTDEAKANEGDPHLKQERRQRGHDIATQRMMDDVPTADVVIVNPQHYAVALKWDRNKDAAPVCVAKGVDEIAARIREAAIAAGVPLHRDPPTARAVFAVVELGEEVRPEHYKAVAAAIRFAERVRGMARNRGR